MEKKRMAVLILTGAMVLGLTACGTRGNDSDGTEDADAPAVTEPADTGRETEEQDTPETAPAPPAEPEPAAETESQAGTPASDETQALLDDLLNQAKIVGDIQVNEEDQTYTYQDGNGNTVTEDIDQDIKNMTDEEIDQTVQNTKDYLQSIIDGTGGTAGENDSGPASPGDETAQGGSTMTPEEFEEWAKQWGGSGWSSENRVDPNDPGYRQWIADNLNG